MNLQSLLKYDLLSKIETLVQDERRITTTILWHLHEIERRRLFAEFGFGSLFDYCTLHLKYSAGSAQRRIASMRLLRELPEIAPKIDSGELNVSAVAQAQSLFRQARLENKTFTIEAKKELIEKLENKSHKECEKLLAAANPGLSRPSTERALSGTSTEIRFEANDELYEKIQKLKGLFAAKLNGSNDFADLLKLLVDQALNATRHSDILLPTSELDLPPRTTAVGARQARSSQASSPKTNPLQSRYIPKQVRRTALINAGRKCTYVDPSSGRRCESSYALEFDHVIPLALEGRSNSENIRILCRTHNQLAAIKIFGLKKMEQHLS